MIKLEHSEHIAAPLERVFAYVTDFNKAAEWQDGVIESSHDGPLHVGSKVKIVRSLMGQRMEATGEVTEYEPNRKFTFRSVSGPMQFQMTQNFASEGSGTKVDVHLEMEAGGFLKIAEPMVAGNIRQQLVDQGKKLKQILES